MSIPKKLALLGLDTATLVLAPLADAVTLGGALTDDDPYKGTHTGRSARKLLRDGARLAEELGED